MYGSVDKWHFWLEIVDINPAHATYKVKYIFSLPSDISDLNLKWYNPWLKSIGSAMMASFMVICIIGMVQGGWLWAQKSRLTLCWSRAECHLEVLGNGRRWEFCLRCFSYFLRLYINRDWYIRIRRYIWFDGSSLKCCHLWSHNQTSGASRTIFRKHVD